MTTNGGSVARIRLRSPKEFVEEYVRGLKGEDLPKWDDNKLEAMERNIEMVSDDLHKVRVAAIACAEEHKRPRIDRAKYAAIALKAWSLTHQAVTDEEYVTELQALAAKFGMRFEDVVKVIDCVKGKGVEVKVPAGRRR